MTRRYRIELRTPTGERSVYVRAQNRDEARELADVRIEDEIARGELDPAVRVLRVREDEKGRE